MLASGVDTGGTLESTDEGANGESPESGNVDVSIEKTCVSRDDYVWSDVHIRVRGMICPDIAEEHVEKSTFSH